MSVKIENKIVGFNVVKPEDKQAAQNAAEIDPATGQAVAQGQQAKIVQMHEKVIRPDVLVGSTYKIKTPVSQHAFYITINDMILNPSTPYEKRRPFEIFINSKNMDHYQWISGLTLIISAVFRKGGDITFLVDELRSVFDPKGGYFKKGGKFMPSLVAEIGEAIESHLKMIGMIKEPERDAHQQSILDDKRRQFEDQQEAQQDSPAEYPEGAILCAKCNTKAVIRMDGCNTCLHCGDSKCG